MGSSVEAAISIALDEYYIIAEKRLAQMGGSLVPPPDLADLEKILDANRKKVKR